MRLIIDIQIDDNSLQLTSLNFGGLQVNLAALTTSQQTFLSNLVSTYTTGLVNAAVASIPSTPTGS